MLLLYNGLSFHGVIVHLQPERVILIFFKMAFRSRKLIWLLFGEGAVVATLHTDSYTTTEDVANMVHPVTRSAYPTRSVAGTTRVRGDTTFPTDTLTVSLVAPSTNRTSHPAHITHPIIDCRAHHHHRHSIHNDCLGHCGLTSCATTSGSSVSSQKGRDSINSTEIRTSNSSHAQLYS